MPTTWDRYFLSSTDRFPNNYTNDNSIINGRFKWLLRDCTVHTRARVWTTARRLIGIYRVAVRIDMHRFVRAFVLFSVFYLPLSFRISPRVYSPRTAHGNWIVRRHELKTLRENACKIKIKTVFIRFFDTSAPRE